MTRSTPVLRLGGRREGVYDASQVPAGVGKPLETVVLPISGVRRQGWDLSRDKLSRSPVPLPDQAHQLPGVELRANSPRLDSDQSLSFNMNGSHCDTGLLYSRHRRNTKICQEEARSTVDSANTRSFDATFGPDDGTVTLTILVGNGQFGSSIVRLDGAIITSGSDIKDFPLGRADALVGKTLRIKSIVSDVNDQTLHTSVEYILSGATRTQRFTQQDSVKSPGDSTLFRAEIRLGAAK